QGRRITAEPALVRRDRAPIRVSSAAGAQRGSAAAFGGGTYFAAWVEQRRSGPEADVVDVYGTRLRSSDGAPLDPAGILLASGASANRPAVATDGTDFLIAWDDGDRVRA